MALDLSSPIATIVADVQKAIAIAEQAVQVVEDFDSFLPANIQLAVKELYSILQLAAGIASKV